jgi:hypothetical protein
MLREWIGFVAACNCGWLLECFVGEVAGSRSVVVVNRPSPLWPEERAREIIVGFLTEHRPFIMEIVDVMGVHYVACGLMMDLVLFGVETCHQSERHSLGSGCISLPLSALSTTAGAVDTRWVWSFGRKVVVGLRHRRSFDYILLWREERGSWWMSKWLSHHFVKCYSLHRNLWLSWYHLVTILDECYFGSDFCYS